MRRVALLWAVASAAVVVVGCGGSDSGTEVTETVTVESSSDALTKAEWIAAADAICQESHDAEDPNFEREYREASDESESVEKRERLADLLGAAVDHARPVAARLRALDPVSTEAEVTSEIISSAEASLNATERLISALGANDAAEAQSAVEELKQTRAKTKGLERGYGLEVCGSDDD